ASGEVPALHGLTTRDALQANAAGLPLAGSATAATRGCSSAATSQQVNRMQAASATAEVAAPAKASTPAKKAKKRPGSGIPARKIIQVLVWVRRVAQVTFLSLFLYFLCQTAFRGTFAAESGTPVRLPYPVEIFLSADPFVGAMTLLSTHTVYRGLAWSLVIMALTLVFGRVFCGWI